jgi:hypothetical protein
MADFVTFELQVSAQEVCENKRAKITNVRKIMDGRPATIKSGALAAGVKRNELLHGARQGIEQFQSHCELSILAAGLFQYSIVELEFYFFIKTVPSALTASTALSSL